jgi:hypothetical protein
MFLFVVILLLIISFLMALLSLDKELKKRGEITLSRKGLVKEGVLFSRD